MFAGPKIEIKFFGWARDEAVNSDKIWGWVQVEDKIYNFWGRRMTAEDPSKVKHLKFKRHDTRWGAEELKRLVRKKMNPGGSKTPYKSVPCTRNDDGVYVDIETVYPNFGAHFKKELMYARLTSTVKGEEV
jgi:hypothetical protein